MEELVGVKIADSCVEPRAGALKEHVTVIGGVPEAVFPMQPGTRFPLLRKVTFPT
jgi:hypothetical protein